jgi:1,4-alpha-glucan branching enzyme
MSFARLIRGWLLLGAYLAGALPTMLQAQSTVPVGAIVQGEGAARHVIFRVWAPNASSVAVSGDFNGWKHEALLKEGTRPGYWTLTSRRARPNDAYVFVVDGRTRRDPRARAVNHEKNQGIILDPRAFPWGAAQGWKMPPKEDLVMYEMHMGTFAQDIPGNAPAFQRAIKRLPYLKALGINCIQLMPINEFPGERSWGYNPSDLFAVESSLGGADGFRSFVRACHTNGIAVLLDIVHNHYGPSHIAAWQFDTVGGENDGGIYFYNDPDRSTTDWGPRPNFSSPDVREFIMDSCRMFLEEYRLDGFRWDSVHNIRYVLNGQRSNADGDLLLSEVNEWMRKAFPDAVRIAEDHAFDGGGVGFDAQWNSAFQATLSSFVRGEDAQRDMNMLAAELSRLNSWQWVNFAECHDSAGDLNQHHRLPIYIDPVNPDGPHARALTLLAGGIVMTVPGYPMLLQGFEMHETRDFSDNTPLPWARAQNTHSGIVRANADLIRLRRNLKGFTPGLKGPQLDVLHVNNEAKVISYSRRLRNAPKDNATVVVINFSGQPLRKHGVRFPASGAWFCHYNSGSADYAKDFDNIGPQPGAGYELPAGQTTMPLDLSRYSLQIFSKSRPPNASLAKAAYAPELVELAPTEEPTLPVARAVEKYIEEVIAPFPYIFVPLPAEWSPP